MPGKVKRGHAAGPLRTLPWYDRAGRFSGLKLLVLVLLSIPMTLIALAYAKGALGPQPIEAAIHEVGNWTMRLILISLAITPARRMLRWPGLTEVRRMIGVAAFAYAAVHVTLYAADQAFDLEKIAREILLRLYLTIGLVALLILTAMAVTSTDGMVRRLGSRRWRRLHRLIYPSTVLALIHFFLQTKANTDQVFVMAGLFVWLMADRAVMSAQSLEALRPWSPVPLAIAAAVLIASVEALHYWIKLGAPPGRMLLANFSPALGPRPAVLVLAICLALPIAGALRRRRGQRLAAPQG